MLDSGLDFGRSSAWSAGTMRTQGDDRTDRGRIVAVVHNRGERPAEQRGRLALEHDEGVPSLAPPGVAQGEPGGAESCGAGSQPFDVGRQRQQVLREHPEAAIARRRVVRDRVGSGDHDLAHARDSPNRLNALLRCPAMFTGDRAASATATAIQERRLIRDAKRGDRVAEARLLALYEPMVRYIALTHFMPGGEREDLAQQARIGIFDAIHAWDPRRRVPFRSFAWLCAVRETRRAVSVARAGKHEPLNGARSLHRIAGEDGHALEDTLQATGRPDTDPVAKALARERLREILARARTLTDLECRALALSANDNRRSPVAAT
jgi:RNA polymerase sporulation-specific sigma factor